MYTNSLVIGRWRVISIEAHDVRGRCIVWKPISVTKSAFLHISYQICKVVDLVISNVQSCTFGTKCAKMQIWLPIWASI